MDEGVGQKVSNIPENDDLCKYGEFGGILLKKIDILSITA